MVISTEEFSRQISNAKVGTRIVLCNLDKDALAHTDAWFGHPKGIAIRQGRFVLLNDEDWGPDMNNIPLTEEMTSRAFVCPRGVVILLQDGTFLLDGETPISEAEAHKPIQVPSAVTRKGEKIYLAGNEKDGIEITEGIWDGWDLHPYGVMFRRKGEVTLVVTAPPEAS